MRALLITVGSRGDAEPFVALADALASKGHHADLFLARDMLYLAPANASIQELPFTQQDFYKYVGSPSHGADHENPRVRFVGIVADVIGELVLPQWEKVLEVARHASVIITSSLARPLALAISQKLGVPLCIVHLQALVPTELFPHHSNAEKCLKAILERAGSSEHLAGYWELEQFQYDFLLERLSKVHTSLGIASPSFETLRECLTGCHDLIFIANAFSQELIPTCPDAGRSVFNVGPLADDYLPASWKAPADLVSFLEGCEEPPVCVGYGSMPFDRARVVREVLRALGLKAVLVGDALKAIEDAEEHVFAISSVPYAWLLPKCSMMLCHGGAGVVNAALRAGVATVISPLMGDQFFWAELLTAKGLGARAGSLGDVTDAELRVGIEKAQGCREAAREMGARIRSTSGVQSLVAALEERLRKE